MLQPRTTTGLLLLALAAPLSAAACSDTDTADSSTSSSTSGRVLTAVAVDPKDFLGEVACGNQPGAMQSYVVTVTDRKDPAHAFTLPSSPPTVCTQDTSFRYVLAGHVYSAQIDGYELPPSELVPLGGSLSGSPHMLRKTASGTEPIAPRWTSACGETKGKATVAVAYTRVNIRHCEPLDDHAPAPSTTAIVVDTAASLGELGCGVSDGQVLTLDVFPDDSTLTKFVGIPCGAPPVTYTAGIFAGSTYTFYVKGHAAGAPSLFGALCFATPQEGLSVLAVCDPLSATGAIAVDPAPLFDPSKGYACPADISEYQATITGGVQSAFVPCQDPVRFDPLDPGDYQITLKAPGTAFQASCSAAVQPGRTTEAACLAL